MGEKFDLSLPAYLFHQGTNYRSYELLGCHYETEATVFRTWAPNAAAVAVTGDFVDWDENGIPMQRITPQGIWEVTIPNVSLYAQYKYVILTSDARKLMKADPYGFHMELRPGTASKVYDLSGYEWGDEAWMQKRANTSHHDKPVNIYEMHAGSWRQYPDGKYFDYVKLAEELIPYLKEMNYTHVELMPITEHPLDDSWGYQVTGYYAATARYGTPHGLMEFVDRCHQAGIGVLLDYVPAHFPKDANGLYEFDGTCCYEYSDPLKKDHPDWGTRVFDYGRNEVRCFLISAALFWAQYYHMDGLRVDAVASMLYLDYGRKPGQWRPNINGGKECLEAIALLKDLNVAIHREFPGFMMIAEESTAWGDVTKPVAFGGLGFDFKWNLGWMHDTLKYMATDPFFRKYEHNSMTFSTSYAYSENYVLSLSHDEVVHGKLSLINKMFGTYEQKFATLKAYYGFMMAHPGKKLMFMGCEFAQFIEWNFRQGLDWQLLLYDSHANFRRYCAALNDLYLKQRPFWERDIFPDGFHWLVADDSAQNVYAFLRYDAKGHCLVCLFNFSGETRSSYRVGVPYSGTYREILNSDAVKFGGQGCLNDSIGSELVPLHGFDQSIDAVLPGLSCLIFSFEEAESAEPAANKLKERESYE